MRARSSGAKPGQAAISLSVRRQPRQSPPLGSSRHTPMQGEAGLSLRSAATYTPSASLVPVLAASVGRSDAARGVAGSGVSNSSSSMRSARFVTLALETPI